MVSIDLNCDMGEGYGQDAEIMPFISSANIACGYHAGDTDTMRRTIELALVHNVAIGAHPSYPDRENFGRTDLLDGQLSPEAIPALVTDQILLLQEVCREMGTILRHVKPHGALYNRAARDRGVSDLICGAVAAIDPSLLFYGLSCSLMQDAAEAKGLTFVSEVFADRTYQDDASLTPRNMPGAMIEDTDTSLQQVLQMVQTHCVTTVNKIPVPIRAETVCVHGDGEHAVAFAKRINETLRQHRITIIRPARSMPHL